MSLVLVLVDENTTGRIRRLTFDLSFLGLYPSGGEPLIPRRLMLSQVQSYSIEARAGFFFTYDKLAQRLHAFGLEVIGTSEDIPVYFTEPDDPLGSPAKVPAGTSLNTLAEADEISAGTDLSDLQHLQFTVEGF